MTYLLRVISAALAFVMLSLGVAQAQECKAKAISATSRLYISKSLGAYPGSWTAWRKAVKEEHGDGWQAWRRAKDQSIECEQVRNASGRKRWQCTRIAVPCKPGGDGKVAEICDGPAITKNLRRGDRGDQVETLQCLLKVYHGADVEVDGNFGSGTRAAVRDFQRQNGLSQDGVVGNKTLEALLS